jgi:hypothetical protein
MTAETNSNIILKLPFKIESMTLGEFANKHAVLLPKDSNKRLSGYEVMSLTVQYPPQKPYWLPKNTVDRLREKTQNE